MDIDRIRRRNRLACALSTALRRPDRAGAIAAFAAIAAIGLTAPGSARAGITYVVNTTGDPGPVGSISLRQAITSANAAAGNTVLFDSSLLDSTITLTAGQIEVTQPMTITGPGAGRLTISGNDHSGIFHLYKCGTGDVTVSGITLTHGSNGTGGAIEAFFCNLTLTDSKVTASYAIAGGAIHALKSSLTIRYSTISGNRSTYSGGGISILNAHSSIAGSSISGNSAGYFGGGIEVSLLGSLDLRYSLVSGNATPAPAGYTAYQGGGGIYVLPGGSLTVDWSTIAQNYAYSGGGGIRFADATAANASNIGHSTIARNSTCCYDGGNGITSGGGTLLMFSTIVANNFNRTGLDDLAGSFYASYCLVRSPGSASLTGSNSLLGLDPKLSPLANYGGPTRTFLPAADSPVIDKGGASTCIFSDSMDQRFLPACGGGKFDIGSVKRQVPEVVIFRNGFDPGG
jgi:hypothetical protein